METFYVVVPGGLIVEVPARSEVEAVAEVQAMIDKGLFAKKRKKGGR